MNNRNSGASADLKDFEIKALKNFGKSLGSSFALEKSDRHFREIKIDGVFVAPGNSLILVEVALGGRGESLKAGPVRKMLSDALKLSVASKFQKDSAKKISRLVLIVRSKWVSDQIQKGWKGKALAKADVEVQIARFDDRDVIAVERIIGRCAEEKIKDLSDE